MIKLTLTLFICAGIISFYAVKNESQNAGVCLIVTSILASALFYQIISFKTKD